MGCRSPDPAKAQRGFDIVRGLGVLAWMCTAIYKTKSFRAWGRLATVTVIIGHAGGILESGPMPDCVDLERYSAGREPFTQTLGEPADRAARFIVESLEHAPLHAGAGMIAEAILVTHQKIPVERCKRAGIVAS